MMFSEPYAKERGAYLLANAGRNLSTRRRAERLLSLAKKSDQDALGLHTMAVSDNRTAGWIHRTIHREDGAANQIGWAIGVAFVVVTVGLVAGVGLMIGYAAYRWWIDRQGRFDQQLSLYAGSGLMALGWLGGLVLLGGSGLLTSWLVAQIGWVGALVMWAYRGYGWPAVAVEGEKKIRLAQLRPRVRQPDAPEPEPVTGDDDEPAAHGAVDDDAEEKPAVDPSTVLTPERKRNFRIN